MWIGRVEYSAALPHIPGGRGGKVDPAVGRRDGSAVGITRFVDGAIDGGDGALLWNPRRSPVFFGNNCIGP